MSKRSADYAAAAGLATNNKKRIVPAFVKGLEHSMADPALLVYSDERIAIIKDKYPKARYHFLVLPKENIANLKALRGPDHVDLLRYIQKKGEEHSKSVDAARRYEFRYGYHAIPSMSRLHMHVISQDFDSPCLKTKKHWNSFTTPHFVDSTEVIRQLKENGHIVAMSSAESRKHLDCDLRCHKCGGKFTTMPKLKDHIKSHAPLNAIDADNAAQ